MAQNQTRKRKSPINQTITRKIRKRMENVDTSATIHSSIPTDS